MPNLTYRPSLGTADEEPKTLFGFTVKTPSLSKVVRLEAGMLIRQLQDGEMLRMPHSRPMPSLGARCHELRVVDENRTWRVIYRIDSDAIVVAQVIGKMTQQTSKAVIDRCKAKYRAYDQTYKEGAWTRKSESDWKRPAGGSGMRATSSR